MMDLPNWTIHVITFALGIATWLPFTLWEGRRVTRRAEESPMDLTTQDRRRRTPRLVVIILVSSALIMGFGVQQGIYQKRAQDQARCIARYNADVETVRDDRLAANEKLADAQTAKDDASDQVLLTVLQLVRTPLADRNPDDLTTALIAFARKKARLATVQQATSTTLDRHPYPTLDC